MRLPMGSPLAIDKQLSIFPRAYALTSARLTSSASFRLARLLGVLVALFFTLAIAYLAAKGRGYEVHGVVGRSAVWIAWLCGSLVALWCAGDRNGIDRTHGIDALARLNGISPPMLQVARVVSSTFRLARLVFLSSLPVAIASLAAAPSVRDGLFRLLSLVFLALFSLCVGLLAGALACICGSLSPRHGRAWLMALVLVPWTFDGILLKTGANMGSLPGLLGRLADLIVLGGAA